VSDFTKQRVVLELPGMDRVRVRRDLEFADRDGTALPMDVYLPGETAAGPLPAVLIVSGYPGPGFAQVMGCPFKELGAYVSWAELIASSGMVCVTYENVDPTADAGSALDFLRDHAEELGIDAARLGIFACSGNGNVALSLLTDPTRALACGVFCYPYLMDVDGASAVAAAAAQFRFAFATRDTSVDDLTATPFLIVRAGRDEMRGLNESVDRLVAATLARNLPVSLTNYAEGAHAFDLTDDSADSRRTIATTLAYLREQLLR